MSLLAAAHVGFWAWGLVLGIGQGTMGLTDALALSAWLGAMGVWLVVVARLSRSGWLPSAGVHTLPAFWIPAPPLILSLIGVLFVPALREAWLDALSHLPAIAIPALNSLRILALGSVLKARRGDLPKRIGYGVGIPDLLFGLSSLAIVISGGFPDERTETVWHFTGATILMLMVPTVLSVLRPPRLDDAAKGNSRAILRFPLVLAPAGLATLFLVLHGLALYAGR